MFTGLVQDRGTVRAVRGDAAGVRLDVRTALAARLRGGDSIAVDGVCLTAVEVAADGFSADVMRETLDRSALARLADGASVNLELALRAGDPLGGHVVQGHVDGVGEVSALSEDGFARRLRIAVDPALLRYIVEKGSVAVDGVSLTVAAVDDTGFEVALIPETLQRTSLGEATVGRAVNIEVDVLAKYVEKLVR